MVTYFMLSRSIFDSAIWRDDPHILKLFIYLIGQARHSKTPKKYPKVTIKRGELVTSLSQIADDNEYVHNNGIRKWSRPKVSRMIKVLEKQEYISIASDTYGTHIKVLNYDTYQTPSNYTSNNYETTMKQPCNNYETTMKTNKNVKNGKNEKNDKKEKDKKKKSSKSKKPKDPKKHYAEFVKMTEKEYKQLVHDYEKKAVDESIRVLDNYKGANGKKYKSDYRAILSWVLKKVVDEMYGKNKRRA